MRQKIFIDAGYIIALINERDQYHQQALEAAVMYDDYIQITTEVVLLEIGNALSRNHKQQAIEVIESFLVADTVEIVRLTQQLFNEAFKTYNIYQDKQWGLVDCVSFMVMWNRGIDRALSFERHFMQAGFQTLLQQR